MKVCRSEVFVTDYSQESPEEDYAESFAHRYLYNRNRKLNNKYKDFQYTPLQKKFQHFETLFG